VIRSASELDDDATILPINRSNDADLDVVAMAAAPPTPPPLPPKYELLAVSVEPLPNEER